MKKNDIKKYFFLVLPAVVTFLMLADYIKKIQSGDLGEMIVVLTAQVHEDDVFQLFYWERSEPKFTIEKSVRTEVKGSKTFQEITFALPEIEDLYRLRLDIGENFDQKDVLIKQISFITETTEHIFNGVQFSRLFSPNKYVVAEGADRYAGKAAKAGSRDIYDPYFISNDHSEEMQQILRTTKPLNAYLISALICAVLFLFIGYNLEHIPFSPKGLFIGGFMLVLFLPTLQNAFQFVEPMENLEKRQLAEAPEFSWSRDFARDFETYYNDNFGLRNRLIDWGGTFRTKLFRSSMHPELVKFGKRKWLFYNKMEGSRMFKSYSRTNLLSEDTLKLVVEKWEDNKRRYEADGRKYFLAFWPNKHSIYPEFLPETMKVQIKDTLTRVDQIIRYINEKNASISLLDVRPALLEAKNEKLIYHKFDSHWNDYGAFLAYRSFFEQNRKELGISPKTEADFDIRWQDYTGGEHIQLLGIRNRGFFLEKNPKFFLKEAKDQIEYLPTDGYPRLTVITRNRYCGNKLKALIFRDSFTNSLVQFFSLHFYEVVYIWGHKEYYVNKEQPDVIIDGFVEREIGEKIQ